MRKIQIQWTVSKAKKTPGHAICSLWENGVKLYSCKGTGDYDMEGTVIAQWLLVNYRSRIQKLSSLNFYGLRFVKKVNLTEYKNQRKFTEGCSVVLDGGCGLTNIRIVAAAIGLEVSEHRFDKFIAFFISDRRGGIK